MIGLFEKVTTGSRNARICWSAIFLICAITCGVLIGDLWNRWSEKPSIVNFEGPSTPIVQIPFPAITICSETKGRQSVYNFTEMYHQGTVNMTEEELLEYETISLVCDSHLVKSGSKFTNDSAIDFLTKIAPQFEETISNCKWKGKINNCSQLFNPVMTEDGLCFTFNGLDAEELFTDEVTHYVHNYYEHDKSSDGWSLDEGYDSDSSLDAYPMRVKSAGSNAGLIILLKAFENDYDYICRGPVKGFKVIVHSPDEIPRTSANFFRVPLSKEIMVAVEPSLTTTSDVLASYDPDSRQCYFPSERQLKFFNTYTQSNCELECLANYTKSLCGCAKFSMPRDDDTSVCSAGSTRCVVDVADALLSGKIMENQPEDADDEEWTEFKDDIEKIADHCDCLPSCTSIDYDAEVSQADYDWGKMFMAYNLDMDDFEDLSMARLVVFFKNSHFKTEIRSELYSGVDFLANCGGLLCFFLGFSILAFVELIYLATLYFYEKCTNKTSRSHNNLQHTDPAEVEQIKI